MSAVNPKDRSYVNDLVIQCLRDSMFVLETTRLVHWGLNGSNFSRSFILDDNKSATLTGVITFTDII